MSAVRDFGAPRNARMQNLSVVTVYCDHRESAGRYCPTTMRGITAAEARQDARGAGWATSISDPRKPGTRTDYCPEHRKAHT